MPTPTYPQYLMPYVQYPYPQIQQPQNQQSSQASQPQIQNSGFILVHSEEEAYRYPVALGHCMTFKVENEPIVIEKSMSFSQLDAPRIDRYRLVREEIIEAPKPIEEVEVMDTTHDEIKNELQAIRSDLEGIKKRLYSNNKPVAKKREDNENE